MFYNSFLGDVCDIKDLYSLEYIVGAEFEKIESKATRTISIEVEDGTIINDGSGWESDRKTK